MAAPTRAQITATYATPTYRVRLWDTSTSAFVTVDTDDIISIDGEVTTNNAENGLSFGDSVTATATVKIVKTASVPATWRNQPIRIDFTFSGADWVTAFSGFITGRKRSTYELEYTCGGIDTKIDSTKIYSSQVYYRRPIATKTTASSVEDPNNVAYNYATKGLLNEIFWNSGGRPYEQRVTYSGADFYYACDQSLIDPEWSWFAGENLLDELYTLARAAGGQIVHGLDNTMRFVVPLNFSTSVITASGFVITDDYYGDLSVEEATGENVGTLRSVYTPRLLQGNQPVYTDDTARLIKVGETITIEGETQLPIYRFTQQNGASVAIRGTTWDNDVYAFDNYSIYTYAQRFTLTINNSYTGPIAVNNIEITGLPVAAAEKGYVSYGSGKPERTLEDNPYIQDRYHAERLTRMAYDFYTAQAATITLSDCGFDPDRFVGEVVTLTSTAYSEFNGTYRIAGLRHSLAGASMEIRLTNVANIPSTTSMFIVGGSYSSGDTREVSY